MVLVFDVGATKTRLALAEGGVLGEIVRYDTDRTKRGFERFLEAARSVVGEQKITGIAGGLPGQIDPKTGVIDRVMNMPNWNGQPVLERLGAVFGCPVYLNNDVVLVGLGEAGVRRRASVAVLAYFTVSSGVNAVRLLHGEIDSSIRLFDIGQQLIADGEGRIVTLESVTGGAAFAERRSREASGVRDGRTWRAVEHYLARGLYNTILHWTPEVIVFGGSMMRDIDLESIEQELQELYPELPYLPKLERAELGDEGGLRGALAWLEKQNIR